MNVSSISKPSSSTTKKAVIVGSTGAAIGGGVAYAMQKKAITTSQAKANANIASKLLDTVLAVPKKIAKKIATTYINCSTELEKVAKSGQLSKKGIAKASAITGITFTALYLLKRLLHSKNKTN